MTLSPSGSDALTVAVRRSSVTGGLGLRVTEDTVGTAFAMVRLLLVLGPAAPRLSRGVTVSSQVSPRLV